MILSVNFLTSKINKQLTLTFLLVLIPIFSLGLDSKDDRPPEAPKVEVTGTALQESILLKEEIRKLREDLSSQKDATSDLLQRTNDLITSQNLLITDLKNTIQIIQNIPSVILSPGQQATFKDAFILNKDGKPFAFIDAGLKLYEYAGGNLLGRINPDTSEIIRNFDNSVVAAIENDFVIDESGHAIGSIERSENLRWDREKLYSKIQKTPVSHFFVQQENPRRFILSPYRSSEWSTQKIEDILLFSEKNIQKLK